MVVCLSHCPFAGLFLCYVYYQVGFAEIRTQEFVLRLLLVSMNIVYGIISVYTSFMCRMFVCCPIVAVVWECICICTRISGVCVGDVFKIEWYGNPSHASTS